MAGRLLYDVAEHVLPYVHGDQVRARVREECPAVDMCHGTVLVRKNAQRSPRLCGTKLEPLGGASSARGQS